jgi:hypothetical protein
VPARERLVFECWRFFRTHHHPSGVLLAIVLAVAVASLLIMISRLTPVGRVDVPKLIAAVKTYVEQLRSTGAAVPAEVSLDQLIARGFLTSNDVAGFTGTKVSVTVAADPQNLNQVLMRARQPNGEEIVALNDGSVQVQRARR